MRLLTHVLAVAAAALLLLPLPAHAERWSSADAEADVTGWHWDPEPAPCGTTTDLDGSAEVNEDITRLSASHLRHRIRMVARFRDLDEALEQQVSFYIQTPRRDWDVDVVRYRTPAGGFRVLTSLTRAPEEPDPADLDECGWWGYVVADRPCSVDGAIDFEADTVTVRLPRSCLRSTAWVRVGAGAYGWTSSADPATEGSGGYRDEWGVREEGDTSIVPPLGPELAAPTGAQIGSPSKVSRVASSSTGRRRSFVISRAGLPIGTTAASAN